MKKNCTGRRLAYCSKLLYAAVFAAWNSAFLGCGGGGSALEIPDIPANAKIADLSRSQVDTLCEWHVDLWGGEGTEFDCPNGEGTWHIGPLNKETCVQVVDHLFSNCEVGVYEQCTMDTEGHPCERSQSEACQKVLECAALREESALERAVVLKTFKKGSQACSFENNPSDWEEVSCDNAGGKSCDSFKLQKYSFSQAECWTADVFSFSIVGTYIACQNVVSGGLIVSPISTYLQDQEGGFEWMCSVWQYDDAFNANSYDCTHGLFGPMQAQCCADQTGKNTCTLRGS